MLYSQKPEDLRQFYFQAWQKGQAHQPLSPLEQQLVNVIAEHPEYHAFFDATEPDLQQSFIEQHNPFLHLGLHLALQEQLAMNRPLGLQSHFQQALIKFQSRHQVEHLFMAQLEQQLYAATHSQKAFDEAGYLSDIRKNIAVG